MISLLLPVILLAVIKPWPVEAHPLAAEFDCTAQTSIPTDQCDALTTIYDETGGEDWLN
ncbi:MAG: hypothetical protein GWO30_03725, partial [Gammaproteobacteria bacterium]|nr:hypothetical protein [Gammaproteobacteria bacterium]NIY19579.1 hypothetical protein [Gammaproteobacteria bacterium]